MTSASPATVRSPISSRPSSSTGRRPLPTAAQGSKLGPFGLPEWALLTGVALIWGSSFLLIEISLESLEPPVITWVRVTLGFLVLAAFPVARRPVDRADYPRSVFLVVLATFMYGVSINVAGPLQQRYGAPAVMMRATGVATVLTALFGLAALPGSEWSAGPALAVVLLGVIQTGAAFVIMAAFVGRVGPTRGSVAVYFIPIVAMVLGVAFRSEVVLPFQWAGTAVVLFGAWLTSRRES